MSLVLTRPVVPLVGPRNRARRKVTTGGIWDRTIFLVGKNRPYPVLFGIHSLEGDKRVGAVQRPMTHIIAFEDLDMAACMCLLLFQDDHHGIMGMYSLDDDDVRGCIAWRIADETIDMDDEEVRKRLDEMHIEAITFNDAEALCRYHGFVLETVKRVSEGGDDVVMTSHYPRGDPGSYVPMLEKTWELDQKIE